MAQANEAPKQGANTAVPHQGDHDRVAMLSLKADGTPDQHNPEFISSREFAEAATRRQFAEQAVSARDVDLRGVATNAVTVIGTPGDGPDEVVPLTTDATGVDPEVARLREAHEAAQKAAEAAADKAVRALLSD